jgi:hypothetical protein
MIRKIRLPKCRNLKINVGFGEVWVYLRSVDIDEFLPVDIGEVLYRLAKYLIKAFEERNTLLYAYKIIEILNSNILSYRITITMSHFFIIITVHY